MPASPPASGAHSVVSHLSSTDNEHADVDNDGTFNWTEAMVDACFLDLYADLDDSEKRRTKTCSSPPSLMSLQERTLKDPHRFAESNISRS